ncbi:MAG: hypothetical protein ACTSX1_03460 [Candidatus Heimdallarchaeaceae archaeon]
MLRVFLFAVPIYFIIGFMVDFFWVHHAKSDEPYKVTIGSFIDNVLQWPKVVWKKFIG